MQNHYYSSSTTYRLNKEDASHHCHHISRCLQFAGFFWAAAINRCPWSVWGQKQVRYDIKSEAYHASPAICPERIAPYFCWITPRYIRVGLLHFIFNRFLSFFSPPLFHPTPAIRTPRYGGTTSTLHTPNHAIRATLVSAYTPPPRYMRHMDTNLHHGPRRQSVGGIRNRRRLDLSYEGIGWRYGRPLIAKINTNTIESQAA